jgi:hypothetical protein
LKNVRDSARTEPQNFCSPSDDCEGEDCHPDDGEITRE